MKCFGLCKGTGVVTVWDHGKPRKTFCGYCYGRGKIKVAPKPRLYTQAEVDDLVDAAFGRGVLAGQEAQEYP